MTDFAVLADLVEAEADLVEAVGLRDFLEVAGLTRMYDMVPWPLCSSRSMIRSGPVTGAAKASAEGWPEPSSLPDLVVGREGAPNVIPPSELSMIVRTSQGSQRAVGETTADNLSTLTRIVFLGLGVIRVIIQLITDFALGVAQATTPRCIRRRAREESG